MRGRGLDLRRHMVLQKLQFWAIKINFTCTLEMVYLIWQRFESKNKISLAKIREPLDLQTAKAQQPDRGRFLGWRGENHEILCPTQQDSDSHSKRDLIYQTYIRHNLGLFMKPFKKGKKKGNTQLVTLFFLYFIKKQQYICTCTCFFLFGIKKKKKKEHQLPKFFTKMTNLHMGLQQYVLIWAQTQKNLVS